LPFSPAPAPRGSRHAEKLPAAEAARGIGAAGDPAERRGGLDEALEALGNPLDDEPEPEVTRADRRAHATILVELVDLACRSASGGAAGLDQGLRDVILTVAPATGASDLLADRRVALAVVAGVAALAVVKARRSRPAPATRGNGSPGAPSTIRPGTPGAMPPVEGEFPRRRAAESAEWAPDSA
jgi:hypothetical protein